jgi:ATP-dependent Lon protease
MRDFRDAKSMAQTLRESLTDKAVVISHGESLELVSRMLGVADWNTLSAMLKDSPGAPALPLTRRLKGGTSYPAIPIRDLVPFPTMTFPLFVGREKTRQALERAFAGSREVVLATQKDAAVHDPTFDDLYDVGTLAELMEVERLPDDTLKVLTRVRRRVAISRFVGEHGTFQAEIADVAEGRIPEAPDLRRAIERFKDYAAAHDFRMVGTVPPLDQIRDPGRPRTSLFRKWYYRYAASRLYWPVSIRSGGLNRHWLSWTTPSLRIDRPNSPPRWSGRKPTPVSADTVSQPWNISCSRLSTMRTPMR